MSNDVRAEPRARPLDVIACTTKSQHKQNLGAVLTTVNTSSEHRTARGLTRATTNLPHNLGPPAPPTVRGKFHRARGQERTA